MKSLVFVGCCVMIVLEWAVLLKMRELEARIDSLEERVEILDFKTQEDFDATTNIVNRLSILEENRR